VRQLVIDTHLAVLPQRAADGATVVRAQDAPEGKARVFKLNAALDDPVLVERCVPSPGCPLPDALMRACRPGGRVERQFRHRCPRCQLQIAYQATPAAPPFLYILKGALTEIQGQVPADAFHGEIPP
jgi:hypothetical protein